MLATLKKLGLSDKEIAVYTALLLLGSASVRTVSDASKINRGTSYDILKSLVKRGLVSYAPKSAKQLFVAEDPARLEHVLAEEQERLHTLEGELHAYIPELQSLFNRGGEKPVVRYFEGTSGIRSLLADVLGVMEKQKEKLYYVYSSSTVRSHYSKAYPNFTEDRIKRKIYVRAIAMGAGGATVGLDERKWLTKDESNSTYTLMYANHIAHIAMDASHQMVGVIIENKSMYETHKMIFNALWERL